jgi:hypothetical protein
MPTAVSVMASDEPPALTNGSVIPVTGSSATTTPILMKAWTQIQAVTPAARRAPNVSGAPSAMRMPWKPMATNRKMTRAAPMSPNSSPMMAKMKSL